MYPSSSASIRLLHVDDDPDFLDLTATVLERENDRFVVETATNADRALDRLACEQVDCIISDYDMPGQNGIEFLEAVREEYPSLPFILFTGKGSEEVASEAISMGVSDYLQKSPGTEQYELLANRILNHVERARAQRQLEARESHLRQAQEIANIGSWHTDIPSDDIYWSDEIFEIFGIDEERLMNHDQFLEYVHPEDREYVDRKWDSALAGERYDIEHRIVTGDGETRWVRERADIEFDEGRPTDALGVVQDITERKVRERQLKALFDNAPLAIAFTEFEDGDPIVRDVNTAFEHTFGYDREAAIDRSLDDLVVPADRTPEAAEINRRVRAGEQFEMEVRRSTPDGLRDFLLYSVPLQPDENGNRSYAIYNDVTDRGMGER